MQQRLEVLKEILATKTVDEAIALRGKYRDVGLTPDDVEVIDRHLSSLRGKESEGIMIADELGLRYDGIQEEIGMQFTDVAETGTTFYANTLEEARTKLAEKREAFAQPLAVSVVDYDRRYTLKELREMARQEGLSASGSKKELAAKLIARGVR